MTKEQLLFKSNGTYLGFVHNGFVFSRDGIYLGWLEGQFVWDTNGKFRGQIIILNGHNYILVNRLSIPPLPKTPRPVTNVPNLPQPPANINPIELSVGWMDAF